MDRNNRRGPVKRATNAERTIGLDAVTAHRVQSRLDVASGDGLALYIAAHKHQAITREIFARSLKLLCQKADISPAPTPYELRHTAISHQADAGRTSWEIADWAGTSEAMISSRYRHRLRQKSTLRPISPERDTDPE
jgi:integrase